MTAVRRTRWRAIGRSVRGAAHVRDGRPNQDAIALTDGGGEELVVLAVADGHGGARYVRSEIGSALAVQVATGVLQDFFARHGDVAHVSLLRRAAEQELPAALVRGWRAAVDAHLAAHPADGADRDAVAAEAGDVGGSPPVGGAWDPRYILYGSTLLAAAVGAGARVLVQLGDGDILTVADDGRASHPMPPDERLVANQTTSLCLPQAEQMMRVWVDALEDDAAALVLLSTDGYANSFATAAGFEQSGADYLATIRSGGPAVVEENLEGWLGETSAEGSGDDVTVGLLVREVAVPEVAAVAAVPAAAAATPVIEGPAPHPALDESAPAGQAPDEPAPNDSAPNRLPTDGPSREVGAAAVVSAPVPTGGRRGLVGAACGAAVVGCAAAAWHAFGPAGAFGVRAAAPAPASRAASHAAAHAPRATPAAAAPRAGPGPHAGTSPNASTAARP